MEAQPVIAAPPPEPTPVLPFIVMGQELHEAGRLDADRQRTINTIVTSEQIKERCLKCGCRFARTVDGGININAQDLWLFVSSHGPFLITNAIISQNDVNVLSAKVADIAAAIMRVTARKGPDAVAKELYNYGDHTTYNSGSEEVL